MKKIAIIGAGWYGCHVAQQLAKLRDVTGEKLYDVTLIERKTEIMDEISGNFGIRLHTGLHYPRSPETLESCQRGLKKFLEIYPDLVNTHDCSIYGIGKIDSKGNKSKVSAQDFEALSQKIENCSIIHDPNSLGYNQLETAIHTNEPSVVVGRKLRTKFATYLKEANVQLHLNTEVIDIHKTEEHFLVKTRKNDDSIQEESFDEVINATSFQKFLPNIEENPLPCNLNFCYQACTAFKYRDTEESKKGKANPLMIMDGWFPCFMPYDDGEAKENESRYILTHGELTILGTCNTPAAAREVLTQSLNNPELQKKIKNQCHDELSRIWPEFATRFMDEEEWSGTVLAKPIAESEFRSAATFRAPNGMIYITPGKINNIFDVENEVKDLIESNRNLCCEERGYFYVKGGTLDKAQKELSIQPIDPTKSTVYLQTAQTILADQMSVNILLENPNPSFLFNQPSKEHEEDKETYSYKTATNL